VQPARAMSANGSTSDAIHGLTRQPRTTRSDGTVWHVRQARHWLTFGAGLTTLLMWPEARHATRLMLEIAWLYFVTGARG
jgi:hypothetical protein